jgi:CRP-like cAMP-binding protein
MTDLAISDALAAHPFLHGLRPEQRSRLAALTRPLTASAGEWLLRESEPAGPFFLIHRGRVAIGAAPAPEQELQPIQTIGPGEVVGWSWLVPPYRSKFSARALEPVTGLVLDGTRLRELREQDHELGFQILERLVAVIAGRLAGTRLQVLDIYV